MWMAFVKNVLLMFKTNSETAIHNSCLHWTLRISNDSQETFEKCVNISNIFLSLAFMFN